MHSKVCEAVVMITAALQRAERIKSECGLDFTSRISNILHLADNLGLDMASCIPLHEAHDGLARLQAGDLTESEAARITEVKSPDALTQQDHRVFSSCDDPTCPIHGNQFLAR